VLNTSIATQFAALRRGFDLVVGGPVLKFFRPEEIELLICGTHSVRARDVCACVRA
jgi:hypothetical protein